MWAFSSCGERGLLIAVASLVVKHRLQVHGLQQLWHVGSVVVAHGLICSAACGIFLDQGSNPCPLHWQADSQPLRHQGSPMYYILIFCFFATSFFKDAGHCVKSADLDNQLFLSFLCAQHTSKY